MRFVQDLLQTQLRGGRNGGLIPSGERGGRPTERYALNPRVRFAKKGEHSDWGKRFGTGRASGWRCKCSGIFGRLNKVSL